MTRIPGVGIPGFCFWGGGKIVTQRFAKRKRIEKDKEATVFIIKVAEYQSKITLRELEEWIEENCIMINEKELENYLDKNFVNIMLGEENE